jgi:hypothetical protein
MRAARSSDHQDLVAQMKGDPFENVAIAMIVGAKTPTVVGSELHRVDDRHGRTIEERRSDRGIDFDEVARFFAAAVVIGMAMIGGACRFFVVIVAVIGVRMEMPAADDRQQLRLVAARRRLDMPVMPAAADERVHQQRGGGEVGDESTHA